LPDIREGRVLRRIHYSWVILTISFFSIIVSGIIINSSGVFIDSFEADFGWDRSVIALAFGISIFVYGISGPFMASLTEAIGLRKMMLISMATLLAGSSLILVINQTWQLILIRGFVTGLGAGLFLTVVSPYVANHWFEKRRGLAVGILTSSMAAGQLVLLPVLAAMIDKYSWRPAMGLLIVLILIMLALIFLFMKNNPQEIGILPYGLEEEKQEIRESTKGNPVALAFQALSDAVKVKEFWLLAGSFFICGFSTNGLIGTHFISFCFGFGIPLITAASLLSFMGVFNLVGTTFSGWLSDRFDNRWLLFWYYGLRGASLLLLPYALIKGSMALLIIFAVFYGLDWIATVPPTISLTRQVFGINKSGIVYGWIIASHQAGAATAAYGGGLIYKYFDTYTWAFLLAGVFCLLASLFVISIKKIRPSHLQEATMNG
jgi:MFS family permease